MTVTQEPNQRWNLDFGSDAFVCGRRFRILAVVDDFSRECLTLVADTALSDARVARELTMLLASAASRSWWSLWNGFGVLAGLARASGDGQPCIAAISLGAEEGDGALDVVGEDGGWSLSPRSWAYLEVAAAHLGSQRQRRRADLERYVALVTGFERLVIAPRLPTKVWA